MEAKPMARDWQPDFEQLVDEHQSMVFSLALSEQRLYEELVLIQK